MGERKKKIMVLTDWFYPGYKAGGPIQSCKNFVVGMEDEYDVSVVTGDHDLGDEIPYQGITDDTWTSYSANAKVFYASSLSWRQLYRIEQTEAPDFVYINSMFSPRFAIMPLLMKRIGAIKATVILAPRGMLKKSALHFKPLKKNIFLGLCKFLSIQKIIHFQATDPNEVKEIKQVMGSKASVTLVPNFPGMQKEMDTPAAKIVNQLALIFVGRIHPIKNLDVVLRSLLSIKAKVHFTIVAPIEDQEYWQLCQALIHKLPPNVTIDNKFNVPHHQMEAIIKQHDLFVLPTRGENFGHAIFEALSAGRPVLISDQTPWKNLAATHAGWDLALGDPALFTDVIEKVAAMNQAEHLIWCNGAWKFCNHFIKNSGIKEQYLKLFN